VVDRGARRDLVESSAEAVRLLVADVVRLVPGARVVVQLDEPSLPAVLDGRVPTASGYGRLRAVPVGEVQQGLGRVLSAAVGAGASTVVHCCAPDVPVALLRDAGAQAMSLDVGLLGVVGWESVAASVEAGVALWAGAVPTIGDLPRTAALADRVTRAWRGVGLPSAGLADVVVTPTCGLAGATPPGARAALTRAAEVARELTERAHG